nr:MAG TPA: hypothetical protein [Caudoviricetes sp.]
MYTFTPPFRDKILKIYRKYDIVKLPARLKHISEIRNPFYITVFFRISNISRFSFIVNTDL